MTKLINFIAGVWLFLFVVYPFVAGVTMMFGMYVYDASLWTVVKIALLELVVFIVLMKMGVLRVVGVSAPMTVEEHKASEKRWGFEG